VGADVRETLFECTDLTAADLLWTEVSHEQLQHCRTTGARLPEATVVAYGPRSVAPPPVQAKPLYPQALSATERRDRAVPRPQETQTAMTVERH